MCGSKNSKAFICACFGLFLAFKRLLEAKIFLRNYYKCILVSFSLFQGWIWLSVGLWQTVGRGKTRPCRFGWARAATLRWRRWSATPLKIRSTSSSSMRRAIGNPLRPSLSLRSTCMAAGRTKEDDVMKERENEEDLIYQMCVSWITGSLGSYYSKQGLTSFQASSVALKVSQVIQLWVQVQQTSPGGSPENTRLSVLQ